MRVHFLAALAVAACSTPCFAWNNLGHKVVAEIAWQSLDPAARQQIVDVLRKHPCFEADFAAKMEDDVQRGDKSTQDHWIFQHAATWPDLARLLKGEDKQKFDHPVWHYVDFPLFVTERDRQAFGGKVPVNLSTEYPGSTPPTEYNVLQAIQYSLDTLHGSAGPETKAVAYCWLFHLVGDIHQPLHSTALFSVDRFPEGDRGGNEIPVTKGKNLHALWDNFLGRQYYMKDVAKSAAELSDRRHYGEVWDRAPKEMSPVKWAEESHMMCEDFVYSKAIFAAVENTPKVEKLAPIELDDDYLKEAGQLARERVLAAGIRLGVLLGGRPSEVGVKGGVR